MQQQINLYQPLQRSGAGACTARTVAAGFGLVLLGLLAMGFYSWRQVRELERETLALQRTVEEHSRALQQLGSSRPTHLSPELMQERLAQTRTTLAAHQHALELLQGGAAGGREGFADRLEALARQRVDGLWVDRIVLGAQPGLRILAGSATDPTLVPRYLEGLAGEPALKGTRFGQFRLDQAAKASRAPVRFEASADAPARGEAESHS